MTKANDPMNPWNPKRPWDNESDNGFSGLTKREYFAAMAMQGMYSNQVNGYKGMYEQIAEQSILAADALIEQLNK